MTWRMTGDLHSSICPWLGEIEAETLKDGSVHWKFVVPYIYVREGEYKAAESYEYEDRKRMNRYFTWEVGKDLTAEMTWTHLFGDGDWAIWTYDPPF